MYEADEDNYRIETEDYKKNNPVNKKKKKRKKKNNLSIVLVIIIAIAIGFSVYFVSNMFFGVKQKDTIKEETTKLNTEDKIVQDLYSYVTYGEKGIRNDKFIKNQSVKLENFSNYDKFYYALQFVTKEDFEEVTDENNTTKNYLINTDKVKSYMEKFFGSNISYEKNSTITKTFNFKIEENNTVTLTYDKNLNGYKGQFLTDENITQTEDIIKPYYCDVVSATKNSDSSIVIEEKIVFVDFIDQGNETYSYNVYQDYEHTILLDKKESVNKTDLEQNPINIEDYKEKAATITYTFKLEDENYYFYSSKINN